MISFNKLLEKREQSINNTNINSPLESFFLIREILKSSVLGTDTIKEIKKILGCYDNVHEFAVKGLKIGELLLNLGLITEKELNEALTVQKERQGERLGEILANTCHLNKEDVNRALKLQKRLISAAVLLLFSSAGLTLLNDAYAEDHLKRANLHVTAFVKPYLKANIVHQEVHLAITDYDIEKGYIEINCGTAIKLKTNAKFGYFIVFEIMEKGIFKEVIISGNFGNVRISQEGGILYLKGERKLDLELNYKFVLEKHLKAGIYRWPLFIMLSSM